MGDRLRFKVFSALAVLAGAATVLAVACGGDDGGGGPPCEGMGCDGGTPESSTTDALGHSDGNVPPKDGGADADSSVSVSCGDAGPPGTLDESFGDGGMVWLKYPGSGAEAVALQPDGKMVVAGGTATKVALVRLLADGSLDPTFGAAGLVETELGALNAGLRAVVLQPDGKIVAVGATNLNTGARSRDFAVLRYQTSGALDPTFGDGGAVVTDFGSGDFTADHPKSVALTADGRILVGGYSERASVPSNGDYALARYNADGSLDATFGTGGRVLIDVQGTSDKPGVIALLAGGKVIIAGTSNRTTDSSSPRDLTAVQVNATGGLDTSFADGGVSMQRIGSTPGYPLIAHVALDANGRSLVSGSFIGSGASGQDFGIARLTQAGMFDGTFGDGGLVLTDFSSRSDGAAVYIQEDGKLMAVGTSLLGSGTQAIALARYLPSGGTLDPSFGMSGQTLTLPPPDSDLGARAAVLTNCHVVAVGNWSYDNNSVPKTAMGIARYHR